MLVQPMTEEEFDAWCTEDTRAEFLDGRMIRRPVVTSTQDRLRHFMGLLLHLYLELRGEGELLGPRLQVRLRSGVRFEPDLLYLAPEHTNRILEMWVEGAPDAVFEVAPRASRMKHLLAKRSEYEHAGVRESWIIDPSSTMVSLCRLNRRGEYEQIQPEEGRLGSGVVSGFWVKPEWLWQEPMPKTIDCLREMAALP